MNVSAACVCTYEHVSVKIERISNYNQSHARNEAIRAMMLNRAVIFALFGYLLLQAHGELQPNE